MVWQIGPYELDGDRFELRLDGVAVAIEPQVLAVLMHLVAHRDRLVTRDDLIATVWNGRIVSEAAISSRIKSARQALGDSGDRQTMIRTVHGMGFRFVHDVVPGAPAAAMAPLPLAAVVVERAAPQRPSIAVLPFSLVGAAGPHAIIAEALPQDLISDLSRLHWLFVIARGSSFQLRATDPDIRQVGVLLGVNYCLSGRVEVAGQRLTIDVELSDTRDCGIIWNERHQIAAADIHAVRAQICSGVIAALDLQIPAHEARIARLRSPSQLDAWASYHLGLQHMYRFNPADNAQALRQFDHALSLAPEFARAHAGLSYCHFQSALVGYAPDPAVASAAAFRSAEAAIAADRLDPFANMTMGRAFWLSGQVEHGMSWLDQAVALNPNYAQGIYSRAWARTITGNGVDGGADADLAMALSPLDPARFAMLSTRALAHLVSGDTGQACVWADRAATSPGAHALILLNAAICHVMGGTPDKAQYWADEARRRQPGLTQSDYFRSVPLSLDRKPIVAALTQLGI